MKRFAVLTLVVGLLASTFLSAQIGTVWQFRWQKGQILTYQVDHETSVSELTNGNKVETSSKLRLVKRWHVGDVDAKGVATVHLSLAALRHEQVRPGGEVLLFDSANPDKSTPELKEQMSQHLGKTLASLRVDTQGRVLEVLQGQTKSYDSEPPFVLVFPSQPLQSGQGWKRSFQVTLDPPLGTGEKFAAVQVFQSSKSDPGKAIFKISTDFPMLPMTTADQIPLLQKQPQGEATFDQQSGRLLRAHLTIDKMLENHQGEGSKYHFKSQYVEQLVAGK